MPDWTAPFHRPRLTPEEFGKRKAEYVAKYGYTITIPGLSDIIKIPIEDPITKEEERLYHDKRWYTFSEKRLEEIRKMKQKRKERYLSMLASPTPEIAMNAGSYLTAIDDAQDALSTLSCIGRIALHAAPRILGRLMAGPLGWMMTAADILNAIQGIGRMALMPMVSKRTSEKATRDNPFTKKARVKRAAKLKKFMPTKGNIIEGLQTTNEVFGVGLCLGPVVGLASDIFFGTVRTTFGVPPKIKLPVPDFGDWYKRAQKASKSMSILWGGQWATDDDMLLEILMAGYLIQQELSHFQQEWNPLDQIEDTPDLVIQAPLPAHPLSLEVIAEEGKPMKDICGWPHSGKVWSKMTDLADEIQPVATSNLNDFMKRNEHNWRGFAGGALASETAMNCLSNLEGEEQIEYDYTAQSKVSLRLLQNGLYPDPDQPRKNLDAFTAWMDYLERTGETPTMRGISAFCADNNVQLVAIAAPAM